MNKHMKFEGRIVGCINDESSSMIAKVMCRAGQEMTRSDGKHNKKYQQIKWFSSTDSKNITST
jgi:hypothetical protein